MSRQDAVILNRDDHQPGQALPPTFEQLFADYQPLVYGICLKFTGTPQDAEDAAQEVFTKIWRNLDEFQEQSSLRTWIYRIAMNTCIDYSRRPWRKFGHRKTTLEDLAGQADQPLLSDENTAEERLLAKEQASRVRKAVTRLKPHLRAVLILKDLEELSYDEISAVLRINLGTISSRLNRARKALQEYLQTASTGPPGR